MNTNKKVVRLTESQLHNIIAESVSQILMELDEGYGANRQEDTLDNTARSLMGQNYDDYMRPFWKKHDLNHEAWAKYSGKKRKGYELDRINYERAVPTGSYDPLALRQRMNQLGNDPQDTLRRTRKSGNIRLR